MTEASKKVAYTHESGAEDTARRTAMLYLDGTIFGYAYASVAGSDLTSYRYLGLNTVVGVKNIGASNTEQTYESGGTGDAGDPYVGLDRFGRLVETLWKTGSTVRVRSKYGRNRRGGIVWRRDEEAHAQSVTTEDKFFWYDGVYRVEQYQRGQLVGTAPNYTGITSKQQDEDFAYDPAGNWRTYARQSPADSETRGHNRLNQLGAMTTSYGNLNPTCDGAGNMKAVPLYVDGSPGSLTTMVPTWDAWNRLKQITVGGVTVIMAYDGLNREVIRQVGSSVRQFYYNDQWRVVEEWLGSPPTTIKQRYLWGIRDRWDLIRRQRSVGGTLDEHLYVLRDGLDPMATVNFQGLIKERFSYDTFGRTRFLTPAFGAQSASIVAWEWLFHCEFRDTNTELYNYGHRWYHAILGRWLSRDPIGEEQVSSFQDDLSNMEKHPFKTGSNLSTYLYNFLLNDPGNHRDFVGLIDIPLLDEYEELLKQVSIGASTACITAAVAMLAEFKILQMTDLPLIGDPSDKRYHCVTSCVLTEICGKHTAEKIGNLKESYSGQGSATDSAEDQIANSVGRDCANSLIVRFGSSGLPGSTRSACECCCLIRKSKYLN